MCAIQTMVWNWRESGVCPEVFREGEGGEGGVPSSGMACSGVTGVLQVGDGDMDGNRVIWFYLGRTTSTMAGMGGWGLLCAVCHNVISTLAYSRRLRFHRGGFCLGVKRVSSRRDGGAEHTLRRKRRLLTQDMSLILGSYLPPRTKCCKISACDGMASVACCGVFNHPRIPDHASTI